MEPTYALNGEPLTNEDIAALIQVASLEEGSAIRDLQSGERLIFGTPWLVFVLERVS